MAGGQRDTDPPADGAQAPASDQGSAQGSDDASASSQRRGKRAGPTIDLKASEIATEPLESAARPDMPPAPDSQAGSSGDSRPRNDTADRPGRHFSLRENISASSLAAGLVGGLLVSLVLFALWMTGMVPIRYAGTTAMRARVTGLEMQVRDLANRPAVDSKIVDGIAQRLGKLEDVAKKPQTTDPALMQRLDAAESAMKSLGVALAALASRVDASSAKADAAAKAVESASQDEAGLDRALVNRIDSLERNVAAAESGLAKTIATANAHDAPARLAVAVSALRDGVIAGEPFVDQLAVVKSLGADPGALAPLEPYAAAGVPREAVLARDLSALIPALLKSTGIDAAPDGGFLDRLQANAGKLVRIRPAGNPAGTDPAAIIARAESNAARNDIDGALAELKKIPPAARAPADDWMRTVEGRARALAAIRKLAAGTLNVLGKT